MRVIHTVILVGFLLALGISDAQAQNRNATEPTHIEATIVVDRNGEFMAQPVAGGAPVRLANVKGMTNSGDIFAGANGYYVCVRTKLGTIRYVWRHTHHGHVTILK